MNIKEANEEKKAFLLKYQNEKKHLIRLEDELRECRMNKLSPSLAQDGMPKSSGGTDLSGYVAHVDDLERKIRRSMAKCNRKLEEVCNRIERLEDESEKDVLYCRYVKNMKWEEICAYLEYSWKHIHRIHGKALQNFSIWDKKSKDDIE